MISLTVSLIAVFIPLLFMSGLVGPHVPRIRADADHRGRDLGDGVADADADDVLAAAEACREEFAVPGLAAVSRGIDRMVEFYHRTLLWVLERQRATLVVTFITIVATLVLYVVAPKGFLPLQDTASITAVTEAGPDVSFAEMRSRQAKAADAIKADPDVIGVV